MVVELLLIKVKLKSCGLRKIMGFDVDSLTLQYKAHKEISVEQKERLKLVLNEWLED